jgi:hypothetical protein
MDLNYLFSRHQVSLMRAEAATCSPSRLAHLGMATAYAGRIDAMRQLAGATGRVLLGSAA